MQISKISNRILSNKYILKSLEKVSEHGTSFSAGAALFFSTAVRPLAINSTPNVEKENKQYAISNSIASGLLKFGIIESVALPVELAIKKIDRNPEIFLKPETMKGLSPRAYKMITQILKLSIGFLTAVPKSMMTIALIPVIMDKIFDNKISSDRSNHFNNLNGKSPNFTGNIFTKPVAKILNNEKIQKLALKYEKNDKDIAKHITAGTDVLLTATSVHQTNKSKDIKENRKRALIYNNVISTGITIGGGYTIDSLIKNKTNEFLAKFKVLNSGDPKLAKYVEGINILRPALIFAFIYYGILPMFSTYIAEKIDKFVNSNSKK